jgi:hypothetical protein
MKNPRRLLQRFLGCLCCFVLIFMPDDSAPCLGLMISPIFRQKKERDANFSSSFSFPSADHHCNEKVIRRQQPKNMAKQHHGQAVLLLHICSLTGKQDEYEFGDLTRWLDQQARDELSENLQHRHFMPHDDHQYPNKSSSSTSASCVTKTEQQHWSPMRYSSFKYSRLHLLNHAKVVLLVWAVHVVLEFHCESMVLQHLPNAVLIEIAHLCLSNTAGIRARILRVVSTEMDHRIQSLFSADHHHSEYHFGDITRGTIKKREAFTTGLDQVDGTAKVCLWRYFQGNSAGSLGTPSTTKTAGEQQQHERIDHTNAHSKAN